ncbi:MAG: hypothetical protein ACRC7H_03800 [Plesiomonas shigelloides]|uniref:hypothetical protein n=1 Tax=Cetobacterium sp. TaxID=2071632 RepID=UPI003F2E6F4C
MKIYGFTYESIIVKSGLFSFNKKELEKKRNEINEKEETIYISEIYEVEITENCVFGDYFYC